MHPSGKPNNWLHPWKNLHVRANSQKLSGLFALQLENLNDHPPPSWLQLPCQKASKTRQKFIYLLVLYPPQENGIVMLMGIFMKPSILSFSKP